MQSAKNAYQKAIDSGHATQAQAGRTVASYAWHWAVDFFTGAPLGTNSKNSWVQAVQGRRPGAGDLIRGHKQPQQRQPCIDARGAQAVGGQRTAREPGVPLLPLLRRSAHTRATTCGYADGHTDHGHSARSRKAGALGDRSPTVTATVYHVAVSALATELRAVWVLMA